MKFKVFILLISFLLLTVRSDSVDEDSNFNVEDCPDMISFDNGITRGQYVNNSQVHLVLEYYYQVCSNNTVQSYNIASGGGYVPSTTVMPARNNGYGFIIGGCNALKLFCGSASPVTYVPVNDSTLFVMYSAGKFFYRLLHIVSLSEKIYKATDKVSTVWPEYAANSKGNITYEQVFQNSAGVQAILPITGSMLAANNYNRSGVEAAMIGANPEYQPGTQFGYNPNSIGWELDSILLRAYAAKGHSGRNLSVLVDEYLGQKLRAAGLSFEFYIGITPDKETALGPRVALVRQGTTLTKADPAYFALLGLALTPGSFQNRALLNPADLFFLPSFPYTFNPLNFNKNIYGPHAFNYVTLDSVMNVARVVSLGGKAKINNVKIELYKKSDAKKVLVNIFNGTDFGDLTPRAYTKNGMFQKTSKYMQQFSDTAFGHPGAPGNEIIIDQNNRCGPLAVVSMQADFDGFADDSQETIYFRQMMDKVLAAYCSNNDDDC